ncbi:MAG: hypothetical protein JSU87_05150 [Gemmatimonadota bacterium]|nr:MAG: hypothetical protein JSU87_05150 [Gemmatimonadota bacterium]
MNVFLVVLVALVMLAAAYLLANRSIARLNRACEFGAGTARFYSELALGGLLAIASVALVFSIPFVWRALRQ